MTYTSRIEIRQREYDGLFAVWRYVLESPFASSWFCIAVGDAESVKKYLPGHA